MVVYIKNNPDQKTNPCRTPKLLIVVSNIPISRLTFYFLSHKYEEKKLSENGSVHSNLIIYIYLKIKCV